MRWNKYLPVAAIYFFINSVALPFGLTFMALLAPVFYAWILIKRKKEVLLPFITILLPFIVVHLFVVHVEISRFCIGILNIIAAYIFGQAVYTWAKSDDSKENVFRSLLVINTILCIIAIPFYFTGSYGFFWIEQNLTASVDSFRRLKMFTYEASYYAMVFVPLFLYYFVQYILRRNTINSYWLLFMMFLPLILSFSIGVIVCLLLAGLFTFIIHFSSLYNKRRIVNGVIIVSVAILGLTGIIILFFPDNALITRIQNIFTGKDTSAMGRTVEAFELARTIINEHNPYWGIGAGQLNLQGADIIREYYLYYHRTPVAIPNAAAETLTFFGWIGFSVRLIIELIFFFVTRVWKNYYRLLLFMFIFLYQFTGSFVTNGAEYVIWAIAFTNTFREYDVEKRKQAV